ncbi:MAG: hypothetical protein A2X22_05855 [Bacteroidetes bacterium GWF2_49_14]|nr:MAG: hypothetical protein A2X22_05855 [Bacteroidetes bacterium GWF2_49_14]HBB92875.1 hypothetical protein [Bacteroidales bacterium]
MKTAGLIALCVLLLSFTMDHPKIRIGLINIRNTMGVVRISVCASEDQFPYHPFRTYILTKDSLRDGNLQTTITDLDPGTYAISLLDDENNSGGMDYNFLGIPQEGYGFANNVKPLLKCPDFKRCLVTLTDGENNLEMIVRYKN